MRVCFCLRVSCGWMKGKPKLKSCSFLGCPCFYTCAWWGSPNSWSNLKRLVSCWLLNPNLVRPFPLRYLAENSVPSGSRTRSIERFVSLISCSRAEKRPQALLYLMLKPGMAMVYPFFIHGSLAAAAVSSERRLDGPLSGPAACQENVSTCKCGGSVPWTAESALPARATGAGNTGQGQPSGLFGRSCTTHGSPSGKAWCFVGTDANLCSDEVRDNGDTALDLWMTSNWYYSYNVCDCEAFDATTSSAATTTAGVVGDPTDAGNSPSSPTTVALAVIVANVYLRTG